MCASEMRGKASGDCRRGSSGAVDLLVSDVYSGAQTPAHLTTIEFYTAAARLLAPEGVLLVNVADGAGLAFARRQVATIRAVLPHVVVLAEVQTLKGRRFGNLVVAASAAPLPTTWLPRLMAAGPHPAKVAQGAELDELVRGALPATDADADAVAEALGIPLRTLTPSISRSRHAATRRAGMGLRADRGRLERRAGSQGEESM